MHDGKRVHTDTQPNAAVHSRRMAHRLGLRFPKPGTLNSYLQLATSLLCINKRTLIVKGRVVYYIDERKDSGFKTSS